MVTEFDRWPYEEEPEYFLRKMEKLHRHRILSRYPHMSEPREKWRYLVATFEQELSRIRASKQDEISELDFERYKQESALEHRQAAGRKLDRALEELLVFEGKLRSFREHQEKEEGETNFKVFQGLLPGEAYKPLRAKMRDNFAAKVRAVLAE